MTIGTTIRSPRWFGNPVLKRRSAPGGQDFAIPAGPGWLSGCRGAPPFTMADGASDEELGAGRNVPRDSEHQRLTKPPEIPDCRFGIERPSGVAAID